MIRVLQSFFDGETHQLYTPGLEIADDPRLKWAETRGLIERIEEEKPKTEEVKKKEPVTKTPAKKPTNKSTKKQGKTHE